MLVIFHLHFEVSFLRCYSASLTIIDVSYRTGDFLVHEKQITVFFLVWSKRVHFPERKEMWTSF